MLLVFSLTFGLIALAEGLIAIGLYRWLGYLVVFGCLLLLVGLFVFIGYPEGEAGQGAAADDRHRQGHRRLPQVARRTADAA